jgi:hypothetical protein
MTEPLRSAPADSGVYVAPAPSGRSLLKATLVALVAAAIVLVVAVLPAEYGIDPLGAGRALGLDQLYAAEEAVATAAAAPAVIKPTEGGPVFAQFADYRVDSREFTLGPGEGMEFKYELDKGATMLYAWKANQYVDFDFHTEPEGKPSSASDSFEKGEAVQKRGAYVAPYNGIHGWYWENKGDRPISITLTTAGFYDEARLFPFKQPMESIEIPERTPTAPPAP